MCSANFRFSLILGLSLLSYQVQENNWEAQYKHAVCNYSLGINDTAVAELKLLLEKQSDYLQAYVMLGKIFMEVGEYVDAEHFSSGPMNVTIIRGQQHGDFASCPKTCSILAENFCFISCIDS